MTQELALVVPNGSLNLIAKMPVATRIGVVARDVAVRTLTSDLRGAVNLVCAQPLAHGAMGSGSTSTPRGISLYIWQAAARLSTLGVASMAVHQSLKQEFSDGGSVRVCIQLENASLMSMPRTWPMMGPTARPLLTDLGSRYIATWFALWRNASRTWPTQKGYWCAGRWACAIPVVLQINARGDAQAHSVAEPSPDADEGHLPRPHARPVRA